MKKIGVLVKTTKPEASLIRKQIIDYFQRRKIKIFSKLNNSILEKGLDWIIVLGGDGAMLHTANKVTNYNIPLIGVNLGHKGYLCQIKKDKLREGLGALNSKNFSVKTYTRIKAQIMRENKMVKELDALNEIVVGGINRAVWLKLKVNHDSQSKSAVVIGDGIIFSTQIGSTAYNLYSGGPILLIDAFSVVACNALFESDYFLPNTKSFVIPTTASFTVKPLRGGQHLPYVVADGQRDYRLQKGDRVVISKSSLVTKLIKLNL